MYCCYCYDRFVVTSDYDRALIVCVMYMREVETETESENNRQRGQGEIETVERMKNTDGSIERIFNVIIDRVLSLCCTSIQLRRRRCKMCIHNLCGYIT